jgi:hypothetical protein
VACMDTSVSHQTDPPFSQAAPSQRSSASPSCPTRPCWSSIAASARTWRRCSRSAPARAPRRRARWTRAT